MVMTSSKISPLPSTKQSGPGSAGFVLKAFGIADEVLRRASNDRWLAVEAELDRFSAYGYGHASQRRFLNAPNARLSGLTPAEALGEQGGIDRVLRVMHHSLGDLEGNRH
jgi:hypothetical protein